MSQPPVIESSALESVVPELPDAEPPELLERFRQRARSAPFHLDHCHHSPGDGRHGRHVVLGFAIHGNEHGTLPALVQLTEELRDGRLRHGGPVTLLLGNPEAVLADERFLDEDFNRVFTFDRPATSRERRRAELVRPLLDRADWFLDFHQTQTPTERAFWTFPWDRRLAALARALGPASVGLTRAPGQAFSAGTCCLDEYVRNRGAVGTTIELGMRGRDPAQARSAYSTARRLLTLVDELEAQTTTLEEAAAHRPELTWYRTAHVVEALGPQHRLRPGLRNWSPLAAGEVLSPSDAPLLIAPLRGVALFPKYPPPGQPPPPELVRIAIPLPDPRVLEAGG